MCYVLREVISILFKVFKVLDLQWVIAFLISFLKVYAGFLPPSDFDAFDSISTSFFKALALSSRIWALLRRLLALAFIRKPLLP